VIGGVYRSGMLGSCACWLSCDWWCLQVRRSSHTSVRRDSHLAQDFWTMAERSFSLFGRTGRSALQIACTPSHAVLMLGVTAPAGCARPCAAQLRVVHNCTCVCAANVVQFFMHRSPHDVVVNDLLRGTILVGRIRAGYFFPW